MDMIDGVMRDVRYGFRTLRRDSGLTVFAVLIVGLGIGLASTVFNVFNALLIRPLPFDDPSRLVWIANGTSENLSAQTVQVLNLQALRDRAGSFADVAAFSPFYGNGDLRITGDGEPERLTGVPITENFLTLLGIRPHLGRFFTAEECRFGAAKTVVLSHGFWQRRYAGDRDVIGRSITLDGFRATVVGVLPAAFDFASIFSPGGRADLFVPFPLSPETHRRGNTLALVGRLRPGVEIGHAQAEAGLIGAGIRTGRIDGVSRNAFRPILSPLQERVSGRARQALHVVAGAAGFLMLLVCANLSNLLLTRGTARQKEMALRTALGAERHRLIRQVLVESVMLSCAGAAIGLALATVGTTLVSRLQSTSIPLLATVRIDVLALEFTMLIALVTGIVVGVLPALRVSAVTPHAMLKEHSRGAVGGGRAWSQRVIVIVQVAVVCILVTGAGLLMRSLARLLDVELGFDAENVTAVRVDPGRKAPTRDLRNAYFDEVRRQVGAVAGIDALGLTDALPLGDNFGWRTWTAAPAGRSDAAARRSPLVRMIDEGYVAAMRIPLLVGRDFTHADTATSEPVVIVNDSLAQALWPGEDPLGRTLTTSGVNRRVVGVVGGVRYFALERGAGHEMYLPLRQTGDYQSVDLVIRSGGLPQAGVVSAVRAALKRVDPDLPAADFRTMGQLVDQAVFARRAVVALMAGFAAFGLLLAALGIYAVISSSVTQRTQEIAIRIALGAVPRDLEGRILKQTMMLALSGLAIGLPASWLSARVIQALLFGIGPFDPVTFAVVPVVLGGVAGLAGYVPARRASRVDPMMALRQ
jgi:predicted permease